MSKLVPLALLTLLASTNALLNPRNVKNLIARQTDIPDIDTSGGGIFGTECLSALTIFTSAPTPPPEIVSFEITETITDPCTFSTPDALKPAFSSYEKEFLSWYSQHSQEIEDIQSKCSFDSGTGIAGDICTNVFGPSESSGSSGSSGSGSGSGSSGSSSPNNNNGGTTTGSGSGAAATGTGGSGNDSGAAHVSGVFVCAVAAAGFLAAVMAM